MSRRQGKGIGKKGLLMLGWLTSVLEPFSYTVARVNVGLGNR